MLVSLLLLEVGIAPWGYGVLFFVFSENLTADENTRYNVNSNGYLSFRLTYSFVRI